MDKNRLIREREAFPLPIQRLTRFIHEGDENYARREKAIEIVSNDPLLSDNSPSSLDLSREQLRERTLARIVRLQEIFAQVESTELRQAIMTLMGQMDSSTTVRFGVHLGLFVGAINGQGSKEQIEKYVSAAEKMGIVGCFSMTELGTGSYLQSLETTATFIAEDDEFEIHTPSLTATKWWIGAAAQTATHTIVFAKLVLNGQDLGTHNFIVQLRDENFDLLPGIRVGDVGPKRGNDGIDNGWVQFDHVRIPRTQMLSKWSRVNERGEYEKSELKQLSYGALIQGRVLIARSCTESVKRAVTIAMRYCTVRDQHSMEGKCLLDYTVQQERLIGAMCDAYAFHFATHELRLLFEQVNAELEQGDISNLKDLHNVAAGMKGFIALWANDAIHQCIFSLGGHGYSRLSKLPDIVADFAPSIPYEGDAILLAQQTASYLVKTAGKLMGGQLPEAKSIRYLTQLAQADGIKAEAAENAPLSLEALRAGAQWLSLALVKEAALELQQKTADGMDMAEAWNACQLALIEASKAHTMFTCVDAFCEVIDNELPEALGDDAEQVLPVMRQVAEVFALRHLQQNMNICFEKGYFPVSRGALLRKQLLEGYAALRPVANRLVDAWDIPDFVLGTELGRSDGEIYENYFEAVNSTLQDIKPAYWEKYLKPRMDSDLLSDAAQKSPKKKLLSTFFLLVNL